MFVCGCRIGEHGSLLALVFTSFRHEGSQTLVRCGLGDFRFSESFAFQLDLWTQWPQVWQSWRAELHRLAPARELDTRTRRTRQLQEGNLGQA